MKLADAIGKMARIGASAAGVAARGSTARGILIALGFALAWKAAVEIFRPAPFLLPAPERVLLAAAENASSLSVHFLATLHETLAGLAAGAGAGIALALLMARSRRLEASVLPFLVSAQALPVFAIAPLLVIWFGFGIGSKIAMASLITFFPVASNFLDGLNRTPKDALDLARSWGATPLQTLALVRIPAALPYLAAGLKIAAALAPIGAIVGEWAGAAKGLGYLMLQANARMQTDMVFACVLLLAAMALALRGCVALALERFLFWSGK